jgi:hypothetical protein
VDTAKELCQVYVPDVVGLDAKVSVVHAEQVPDEKMGSDAFPVGKKAFRLYKVEWLSQPGVDGNDLPEFVDVQLGCRQG